MIRKILLLAGGILFASLQSDAQCVIDTSVTHNDPGIYPDTITNLPHAVVGTPYSTVIQVKVLTDTNIMYMGFPVHACFDSIVITGVGGLPSGYSYSCTPASCGFPGGGDGCILLQGPAPTSGQIGQVYPIQVYATGYAKVCTTTFQIAQDDTVFGYKIVIDDNTGIPGIANPKFDVRQNMPNPFSNTSVIEFSAPNAGVVTLKISNMLGKVVYTRTLLAQRGQNRITVTAKDFGPGVYFYTISSEKNSLTRRMIVDHE